MTGFFHPKSGIFYPLFVLVRAGSRLNYLTEAWLFAGDEAVKAVVNVVLYVLPDIVQQAGNEGRIAGYSRFA